MIQTMQGTGQFGPNANDPMKKEEKQSKKIPESVLTILKNNLNSCLSACNSPLWGSHTSVKNEKEYLDAHFNTITGGMKILVEHELSKAQHIFIRFTYESATEVALDREDCRKCLKMEEISITAAKILLAIEKLLSMCHTFGSKKIRDENEVWTDYEGSIDKAKLKKLIDDETSEKIIQVWESINNRDFYTKENNDFLIGQLYQNNPLDMTWDPSWTNKDLKEEEFVIIKRSNKQLRFAKIKTLMPEKVTEDNIQVMVTRIKEHKIIKNGELRKALFYRW